MKDQKRKEAKHHHIIYGTRQTEAPLQHLASVMAVEAPGMFSYSNYFINISQTQLLSQQAAVWSAFLQLQ